MTNIPTESEHKRFISACEKMAQIRKLFSEFEQKQYIGGNDNHIGEYWVARYYDYLGESPIVSSVKTSPFDIQLNSLGDKISVKTMTTWNKNGKGSPVKFNTKEYQYLAAVYLNKTLMIEKLAIAPIHKLREELIKSKNIGGMNIKKVEPFNKAFEWWPCFDSTFKVELNQFNSIVNPASC